MNLAYKTHDLPACKDSQKTRSFDRPAPQFHLLTDPRLHWLGRHWSDLRGWADIPKRRHLEPLEIRRDVLPWVFLIERRDHGFWFGLSGSGHTAAVGKELTGRPINSITVNDRFNAHLAQLFRTSMMRRRPFYSKDKLTCGPVSRYVERLVLPMSDTDNCATSLLVVQVETDLDVEDAYTGLSLEKLTRRYPFYLRPESFEPLATQELYL